MSRPYKGPCTIEDCEKPILCRGWCNQHYQRWRKHGDPLVCFTGGPEVERFWRKVDKEGPVPEVLPGLGNCWLWIGGVTGSGYGIIAVKPRRPNGQLTAKGAHCFSYELHVGPIPEGLVLDHLCRVTACVRPGHLEPVTHEENLRRGRPSVSAINRAKTHCDHGHPLSGENLWMYRGGRHCRTCKRRIWHEWKARKDAKETAA